MYRYVFNDAETIISFTYKSGFAFGDIQLAFRTIYKNGYTAFKGQSFGLKRPCRSAFLAHRRYAFEPFGFGVRAGGFNRL